MIQAIKQHVTVQADGLIQIHVPEFEAGTLAEVIVLKTSQQKETNALSSFIGKGQGCFSSPEEADEFLGKERQSWD